MNKKAFIETQLNWIYILVVGTLILVFFIMIAKKYMTNQEIKINANVLEQLDTTILGASQAAKAANKINIEDTAVTFECSCAKNKQNELTNNCKSTIEIGDNGIAKDTAFIPIFSPKKIENSQLITWTLDWSFPFKISNLLYITRDDAYYYFVTDGKDNSKEFAQQLYDLMEETQFLNVKILQSSEVASEVYPDNIYLLRFIYVSESDAQPSWIKKIQDEKEARNINIITIKPVESGSFSYTKIKENNKLEKNIKQGDGGYYLDIPSLIGAVFSEDETVYRCNLLKAFKRYQYISHLYGYRAEVLANTKDALGNNPLSHCSSYYNEALNNLNTAINVKDDASIGTTISIKQSLEEINEQILLAPGGRCPRLY
jgi:hypothetical protein